MNGRILIADSDPAAWLGVQRALALAGCEVVCAPDADAALGALHEGRFDLVLCDLRMRFRAGSEQAGRPESRLVSELARRLSDATLALTSDGEAPALIAEALERGVSEVVAKPAHPAAVRLALHRARERSARRRRCERLEHDLQRAVGLRPIVAASPVMIDLLERVERTAADPTPLLITGEPGSGKQGIARAVHAQSARRSGAFVVVDCATGSELERERRLFGSGHGSLPGGDPGQLADADGGTLYLDAVDALPAALQTRLLAVIRGDEPVQGRRADVRWSAATAHDLEDVTRRGSFRKELYEQLQHTRLRVPALRERPEDIPLLVDHFLARADAERGRSLRTVTGEALERLVAYHWPGNVRELAAVIERAADLAPGDGISLRELPEDLVRGCAPAGEFALRSARRRFETDLIRRALGATGGNRTRAARLLEISHRALLYKLKDYELGD